MNKGFKYCFMIIALMQSQRSLGMQALAKKQNAVAVREERIKKEQVIIDTWINKYLQEVHDFYKSAYERPDDRNLTVLDPSPHGRKLLADMIEELKSLNIQESDLGSLTFKGYQIKPDEYFSLSDKYVSFMGGRSHILTDVENFPQVNLEYYRQDLEHFFGPIPPQLTQEAAKAIAGKFDAMINYVNTECKGRHAYYVGSYLQHVLAALNTALDKSIKSTEYRDIILPKIKELNAAIAGIILPSADEEEVEQMDIWEKAANPLLEEIKKDLKKYADSLYYEKLFFHKFEELGLSIKREKTFNPNGYVEQYEETLKKLPGKPMTLLNEDINKLIGYFKPNINQDTKNRIMSMYGDKRESVAKNYAQDIKKEILAAQDPVAVYKSIIEFLREKQRAETERADKDFISYVAVALESEQNAIESKAEKMAQEKEKAQKQQKESEYLKETLPRELAEQKFAVDKAAYENPTKSNEAAREAYEEFKEKQLSNFSSSAMADVRIAGKLREMYKTEVSSVTKETLLGYLDGIAKQIQKSKNVDPAQAKNAQQYAQGLLGAIMDRSDFFDLSRDRRVFKDSSVEKKYNEVRKIVENIVPSE